MTELASGLKSVAYFHNRLTGHYVRCPKVALDLTGDGVRFRSEQLGGDFTETELNDNGYKLMTEAEVLRIGLRAYADENNWLTTGKVNRQTRKWAANVACAYAFAADILKDADNLITEGLDA